MSGSLTGFLLDVLEMRWSEYDELRRGSDFTALQATIISLIDVCASGNLRAIQEAFDRTDGKVAKEIEVELPKFYFLYPHATMAADDPDIIDQPLPELPAPIEVVGTPDTMDEVVREDEDEEKPTTSLREALGKMIHVPISEVESIIASAKSIEEFGHKGDGYLNPRVKYVVVANLIIHMLRGKKPVGYILEVLEQIDGKVAEKIKVLGGDIYIKRFDTIAPAGAERNADGVYQMVADNTTNTWAARLDSGKSRER